MNQVCYQFLQKENVCGPLVTARPPRLEASWPSC